MRPTRPGPGDDDRDLRKSLGREVCELDFGRAQNTERYRWSRSGHATLRILPADSPDSLATICAT